jgi:hypothetical protein
VEVLRDGLGEGFDFSVTTEGEDRGVGLGLVVVRWSVVEAVTVLPGVVTESEEAVVVVVRLSPSIWRRT